MIKVYTFLIIFLSVIANAQVAVTGGTTAAGTYSTLSAAVTAINTSTITGAVTVNVDSNFTENTTSQILLTKSGTSGNQVVFRKKGTGANPKITRTDGGNISTTAFGGLGDAVFRLDGCSYITFDGIDIAATSSTIEYGYFTFKPNSTTGCTNDTIRNSTVTMTKGTLGTVIGIYISNGPTSTSLANGPSITAISGENQNIAILKDTVQNVNAGILSRTYGSNSFLDQNLTIGLPGAGNIIRNYGGDSLSAANGIVVVGVNNPVVTYNTVNNSDGGKAHRYILNGITMNTCSGVLECGYNNIKLESNSINFNTGAVFIYSLSNANYENIHHNVFSSDTMNCTGTVYLIYALNDALHKTITHNSISNGFYRSKNGNFVCYYGNDVNFSRTLSEVITDNNFSNIVNIATVYGIYGNYSSSISGERRISNNILSNWTGSQAYPIYIGWCDTSIISNNYISNINTTGTTTCIYLAAAKGFCYSNTIRDINTSGSAISAIISVATVSSIFKNKIADLNSTNINASLNGILTTNGAITISNNYIGGLTAPNSEKDNSIIGINLATGSAAANIYYNTVYMNAASTGDIFGSSAFYSEASVNLALRNNIFVNRSTPKGNGYTVAYRRGSTTLTTYQAVSNNNLFYAGIPAANNLVFYDGTNADQTLTSFKARVANRDSISVTEYPPFVSTTSTDTTYLHIDPNIPTQVESGAKPLTGYTDDFDGNARNATTPDIGADEGSFTSPVAMTYLSATAFQPNTSGVYPNTKNNLIIGIKVITTGVLSPLNLTGFKLNTTGTTSSSVIKNAIVYYSGTDSIFTLTKSFGSPVASPYGSFSVSGSQTLMRGTNYFWLAYDMTCDAGSSNSLDAECDSIIVITARVPTIRAPSGNRAIIPSPALTGSYSIGSGGDYTTLTTAFADIAFRGLSGNTTFNILNNITEPGQVVIRPWTECGGTGYSITIKPSANTNDTISGSVSNGPLIKLLGVHKVIIDGSNNGSSSRNLSIINTNSTGPTAIALASTGSGAGNSNITIKNCNISTGISTAYGIAIGGKVPGTGGADNDSVTIQNNNITVCAVGIYANGADTISQGGNDKLVITGNTINITNAFIGIQAGYCLNSSITGNTLSVQTNNYSVAIGISIETGFVSSIVDRNTITKVISTINTNGFSGRGIIIGTGTNTSNLVISNNVIYGVNGQNTVSAYYTSVGIGIGILGNGTSPVTTGGVKLYFNSVNMNEEYDNSSGAHTYALLIQYGVNNLDIRNNVFANSMKNTNPAGAPNSGSFAVFSYTWTNSVFTNINYNDYYSGGPQGILGHIYNTNYTTLSAWKTGTGKDANSLAADPLFNSPTYLLPSEGSPLANAGTPITGITADITGYTRSTTSPTIGAYEQTLDITPPVISYLPLPNTLCNSNKTLLATITDVNGVNTSSGYKPRIYFKKSGNANSLGATNDKTTNGWKYSEASNSGSLFTFTIDTGLINGGVSAGDTILYFVIAQDIASNPNVAANRVIFTNAPSGVALTNSSFPVTDTINSFIILNGGLSGTVSIGATGNYPSITGIGGLFSAINSTGLTGNLIASIIDTNITETGVNALNRIRYGCVGTYTLTIKPAAGVTSKLTGPVANNTLLRVLSSNVIIDGSNAGTNSRDLTISNTSGSAPQVLFIGSPDTIPVMNITLKNMLVINGSNSGTAILVSKDNSTAIPGYFNNITIQNNSILKAGNAICFKAVISPNNGNNILIKSNEMMGSGQNSIRFSGIYVQGANSTIIADNSIGNIVHGNAEGLKVIWLDLGCVNAVISGNVISNINLYNFVSASLTGIYTSPGSSAVNILIDSNTISNLTSSLIGINNSAICVLGPNTTITRNKISGLTITPYIGTALFGILVSGVTNCTVAGNQVNGLNGSTTYSDLVTGIYLNGATSGVNIFNNRIYDIKNVYTYGSANGILLGSNQTNANIKVYNNFISDIASSGNLTTADYNANGILVVSGGGYGIYHNSVYLNTNQSASGLPAAFKVTSGVSASNAIDLRNNIFSNTQTTGTNRYSIYSGASGSVFSNINNNAYWSSGPNLGYIGSNRATIANIQSGFGGNSASIKYNPSFVSGTDLHLITNTNWCLNASGASISSVTNDIDTTSRNSSTPDIGADEFNPNGFVVNTPGFGCGPFDLTSSAITSGSVASLTFTYWRNASATLPLSNANEVDTSGTYYIKATDTAGCSYILPITLNLISSPGRPSVTTPVHYCQGSTVGALTATASSGSTLRWYTSASGGTYSSTAPTPNTVSAGSTTYYVSQVNTNTGCESGRAPITVIIDSLPPATAVSSPVNYCLGATANALTAATTSGNVLHWYTSATGGTWSTTAPIPNTSVTGITKYYVGQATATLGCEGPRDSIIVNINPNPAHTDIGNITICPGDTAYLQNTDTATYNYTWYKYNAGSGFTALTNTKSMKVVDSGLYYILIVNAFGCSIKDTVKVTMHPGIKHNKISNKLICQTDSAYLQNTDTSTSDIYKWYFSGNIISTIKSIYVKDTGTYIQKIQNIYGCIKYDTLRVDSKKYIYHTAIPDYTICNGETVHIINSDTCVYTPVWRLNGNLFSTTKNADLTTAGLYLFYMTNNVGCTIIDSVKLTVLTTPTHTKISNKIICSGDSAYLQNVDSAHYGFEWTLNGNVISNQQNIYVKTAGTYYQKITHSSGCVVRDSVKVTVNLTPSHTPLADMFICSGDSVMTQNTDSLQYLFSWYRNGSLISNQRNIFVKNTGIYVVKVASISNCFVLDTFEVFLSNKPNHITIPDISFCNGDSAFLQNNYISTNMYKWYFNGNLISTQKNIYTTVPGEYVVKVESSAGCILFDTVEVNKLVLPVHVAIADNQFCEGDSVQLKNTDSSTYLFNWYYAGNMISSQQSIYANAGGTYILKITNTSGCYVFDTIQLTKNLKPTFSVTPLNPTIIKGTSITIKAIGTNYTYQWSGDSIISSWGDSVKLKPIKNATYKVIARTSNNCIDSMTFNITVDATGIMNENRRNAIKIFPNPATSELQLNKDFNDGCTLTITDNIGKVLLIKNWSDINTSIDISTYAEGVYTLIISNTNFNEYYKFMKVGE